MSKFTKNQQFSAQAILQKINTLSNGTVRVVFDLNENPEVEAQIMRFKQKFGTLAFVVENE